MEDEFVSFETANLAKEKGFDEPTLYAYDEESKTLARMRYCVKRNSRTDGIMTLAAPTRSQLQRWLRKEKGYYVYPFYDNNEFKWTYSIREKTGDMWLLLVGETPNFDLFEEAMEAGLKYALKNLIL